MPSILPRPETAIPTAIGIIFDKGSIADWVYTNGKTRQEWFPWLDIQKTMKTCKITMNNLHNVDWKGQSLVDVVKDIIRDSPNVGKMEICLHYKKGEVEERYMNAEGKAKFVAGQKDHVHAIAKKLWDDEFAVVKEIGFTIQRYVEQGRTYPYHQLECLERSEKGWGDWVQEQKVW